MNLLSIQSHVAYGHVGNAAAVFAMQRLGVEVWPVHTVQFSNHTGYGAWKGQVFDAAAIRDVVLGIAERGILGECDGILSGYLGSVAIGEAVLESVDLVKRANPLARYCCDPVIGDADRGVFVAPGIAEFLRRQTLPLADLATPNQFELGMLTGRASTTAAALRDALAALHDLGPAVALVTSVRTEDTPPDCLDTVAADTQGIVRVRTPLLPFTANGAGDLIAALFFVHYLQHGTIAEAATLAASATFGILHRSAEEGSQEMLLIAAQEELVTPSRLFRAQPLSPGS
jgi:pyridoxine kinase